MKVPTREDTASLLRSPLSARSIRVLLLQARTDPRMIEQEQQCFVERCHLRPEQFRIINVVQGGRPTPSDLQGIDAVLIGGAGAFSAVEDYEWTPGLLDFVQHTVERDIPLFGSCWGHQVIARALGGRVVYDPDHSELGCGWVELTEAGRTDPLFHRFSRRFRANMGHHDRVVELPEGATELARNEVPYQAFRIEGPPVYATQFHSELDAKRERERILVYRNHYQEALPDEETVQRVLAELADTTEVDHLLYDFLTTFVARSQDPVSPKRLPSRTKSLPTDPIQDGPAPSDRRIPDA